MPEKAVLLLTRFVVDRNQYNPGPKGNLTDRHRQHWRVCFSFAAASKAPGYEIMATLAAVTVSDDDLDVPGQLNQQLPEK